MDKAVLELNQTDLMRLFLIYHFVNVNWYLLKIGVFK